MLVNAFGMDVMFLRPLIDHLSQSFRVITWGSRGLPDLSEPFPAACDVTAHARDLGAVLDHHGVDDATLVGWCTGAQVALRFAAMAPERTSAIVSLHGAFSFPESVGVTSFKRNIMYLMPRIARGQEHARAYHAMFYGGRAEGSAETEASTAAYDDEARAAETMLSSDELLFNLTSAPFKTPEALYRYANLVMHLIREPDHVWAPFVECPVLVLSGERDSIAHPDESRELARRLKRATPADRRGRRSLRAVQQPPVRQAHPRVRRAAEDPESGELEEPERLAPRARHDPSGYVHGIVVPPGLRTVHIAGQLGAGPDRVIALGRPRHPVRHGAR